MTETMDLFEPASLDPVDRWCPICHSEVQVHEDYDLVPVCPLVYPEVAGLYVHEACLETERAHDIYVLRDRPRNLFVSPRP